MPGKSLPFIQDGKYTHDRIAAVINQ